MTLRIRLPGIIHSRPHLSLAVLLGALAAPLLPNAWPLLSRLLTAWNITVWSYLLSMWWMMVRADQHDIHRAACRQDEKGPVILTTLSLVIMISLVAIISQLSALKDVPPADMAYHYGFVVLTLTGSWFMIGTMFCSHYAHLYYIKKDGEKPLQFPDQELTPNYWDFLYFSFTISMAVQTSDVAVRGRAMRQVVLGQSVLCFFYNLAILGLSINIAASLING
ncbi:MULTISPECIES: DUF1345 domain-containing protein [unclassified Duganella]|uniref:DUF1345 domain-containing protein n=1 Tax=unclassified Duganella TaxID=2636909 RepID=UPI000E347A35|nr:MULTISPECIES: DUF1345 domain-containing protein [unclassified Duganella]RFP08637.1 DUF1345 domain-containing protein [Duganella sp. BJB475]RFP27509.1 DUF1345 domain-containing protein [Duganella sp. BJB476]